MDGTTLNYLVQGINKKGTFTGSYENDSGTIIGYTGKNAEYQGAITLPGITTIAVAGRGINDKGDIVGWYEDSSGVQHGFLLSGKTATTIDNPNGATNLEGINNTGEASGLYTDSSGNRHGFTYDIKKKKFTELTVPGSTYVEVWGLNDNGVVAIDGENSSGVFVGYLYCPKAKDCPGGGEARSPQIPFLHHVPRTAPTLP
jgi:probable HAF family extracellular repeat protein